MDKRIQGIEEVVGKTRVYSGAILDLETWEVRLQNGKAATREIVLHKGAAAIVPVNAQGQVAMVRQYRPAIGEVTLEIPAGKLDQANEDPLLCAQRELREETGLVAQDWRFLMEFVPSVGYLTEVIHLFMASGLSAGQDDPDEDEFIDVQWYDMDALLGMVMRGEIRDGKTAVALLMAARILQK